MPRLKVTPLVLTTFVFSSKDKPQRKGWIWMPFVVGYLILEARSTAALSEIVKVIHSCDASNDALSKLGGIQIFMHYLIRACKLCKLSIV
jgi:hypothetical protein